MLAVAHAARLDRHTDPKDAQSLTHRQSWESLRDQARARESVNDAAEIALREPEYPAFIHYLRVWSDELVGRSGVGMDGAAPLSNTELLAWCINTGTVLTPSEQRALMRLDTVRRHPETLDTPKTIGESDAPKRSLFHKLWPSKDRHKGKAN